MTLGTVELRAMYIYVQVKPICYKALVTYGVRSPKLHAIWPLSQNLIVILLMYFGTLGDG